MLDDERSQDLYFYENLANAIIVQAAHDYRTAIASGDRILKMECERFFKSQWYQELTTVPCQIIIRACKE